MTESGGARERFERDAVLRGGPTFEAIPRESGTAAMTGEGARALGALTSPLICRHQSQCIGERLLPLGSWKCAAYALVAMSSATAESATRMRRKTGGRMGQADDDVTSLFVMSSIGKPTGTLYRCYGATCACAVPIQPLLFGDGKATGNLRLRQQFQSITRMRPPKRGEDVCRDEGQRANAARR